MASLDHVFDFAEKLSKDNISYFVVTVRKGFEEDKADLFFDIKDDDTLRSMQSVFTTIAKEMEESDDIEHFYEKKKRKKTDRDEDDGQQFLF
jgi:hypothetical protein